MPTAAERRDRLPRHLERERLVEEECPRPRVDDGRPLVADDRLGETDVVEVALDRPEHPARRDEDGNAERLRAGDRGAGAVVDDAVRRDQRPVEVAGERLDPRGEVREVAQPPVAVETNCATSAICCGSS